MVGPVGELAETTSLLRMRSRKITEGSNPSLSAIDFHDFPPPFFFIPLVLGKFDLSYFVLELDSRIECADDFFKMCVVDILAFVAFEILL